MRFIRRRRNTRHHSAGDARPYPPGEVGACHRGADARRDESGPVRSHHHSGRIDGKGGDRSPIEIPEYAEGDFSSDDDGRFDAQSSGVVVRESDWLRRVQRSRRRPKRIRFGGRRSCVEYRRETVSGERTSIHAIGSVERHEMGQCTHARLTSHSLEEGALPSGHQAETGICERPGRTWWTHRVVSSETPPPSLGVRRLGASSERSRVGGTIPGRPIASLERWSRDRVYYFYSCVYTLTIQYHESNYNWSEGVPTACRLKNKGFYFDLP